MELDKLSSDYLLFTYSNCLKELNARYAEKKQIEKDIQELQASLVEAKQGMPAHLIREKIRLLKNVIE